MSPAAGSSPLARGPLKPDLDKLTRAGLIPARAGTTLRSRARLWWMRAHPRSRGDHRACDQNHGRGQGSSPLARGPQSTACQYSPCDGLIPARAGTTEHVTKITDAARAHPRSRGDHFWEARKKPPGQGSSPLARGPRADRLPRAGLRGLIPARAGTTSQSRRAWRGARAHPRSRGDH